MKVLLVTSGRDTTAYFVLGHRVTLVHVGDDTYYDGRIEQRHFNYIQDTRTEEFSTEQELRHLCAQRHARWAGVDVTGIKTIPFLSVDVSIRCELLQVLRERMFGRPYNTPYILALTKTVNARRRELEVEPWVADTYKKVRRTCTSLGKLIGQAKRGDDDPDVLRQICDMADDIEVYAVGIKPNIQELDIGLEVATCGHLEICGDTLRIANSRGRLTDTCCQTCYEDSDVVVYCIDDGYRHWRDDVYYWESDDEYHLTEEQDDYNDNDEGGADPNYRLDYSSDVMCYLSKDESFKSTAHGDFHMGVELETAAREREVLNTRVATVRQELGEDYLVCKYDGSVGEFSMEWVTRPTNLATHIKKFGDWKSTDGLVAWNNRSCGMHIHIDSQAFTALTLGKMIQFYNKEENADFIRSIAGRHPSRDSQASEYAALDDSRVVHSPTRALKGKDPSRYRMINCENLSVSESRRLGLDMRHGDSNTVEIRIFRASLKKERLLAQIEFAHAAVMFCRVTSYRELTDKVFLKWLRTSAGMYPNLAKWFNVNHRHGSTVTNTDPIANAAQSNQPELFAQAA